MEEVFDHAVYMRNTVEFVTVGAEYCAFVESAQKLGRKDFMGKSLKLLSLLYLKATILPNVESVLEGENEKFVMEQDWIYVCNNVRQRLGEHDVFLQVASPILQQSEDLTNVSISEVFADIYQDLQDFIQLYRTGDVDSMNDALWECKMNFEQFWGQRLLSAMCALHEIYFGKDEIDDDDDNNDWE